MVYHSGTGETLRLSDAAVAILDLLEQTGPMGAEALTLSLAEMMDDPPALQILSESADKLLGVLLRHECIERAACD